MQNVIITPLVRDKIKILFTALLEKNYFSEMESADDYCTKIENFIDRLATQKHHLTRNPKWGKFYAAYKINRRTTWFITFDLLEGRGYLVRNIFNNHTEEYPLFIR